MKLFIFGLGYTAGFIARDALARGDAVAASVRTRAKAEALAGSGLQLHLFDGRNHDATLARDLATSDAVLVSVPPDDDGDPVLRVYGDDLAAAPSLRWIGYLSTIGVYGDRQGGWVDEASPPTPGEERSRRRLAVEQAWLAFGRDRRGPVQVFRLAGIYGPGRNQLDQLAVGTARRIVKPGQVFNRIHVDDIVQTVAASRRQPRAGAIYNVVDDEPAPPQDVVAYAAGLCGVAAPPEIPFAQAELSPMSRSFFSESKRVRSRLLSVELGVRLRYRSYREGLSALRAAGEGPH
ncbi:SDR family oxidoreductase [Bradyrhizobium sp. WD16]|uniref:SDR family oxidoreductase n=1 Tax=Bradyrhizobium sp. WD16 TaxID=1521768 RepID=UPI0020A44FC6|nr:SDR family oxidoreductase [Bradyrhizobium sp. WD16]UTD29864.1 NAD(P)-dependent oxidoreductase [Bradyrhizobium sp. WD16]